MARLLVSVMDVDEALAALSGGADVVDTKDPRTGALGALTDDAVRTIRAALPAGTPLSVALGDAADVATTRTRAAAAAEQGAAFAKIGFAGVSDERAVRVHLDAARAAASSAGGDTGVVAVAYADADRVGAAPAARILAAAAGSAARGILLDTACKDAPGLFGSWDEDAIRAWIDEAHAANLLVAMAGRLDETAVARAAALGADIVGARGAACEGGRLGRVSVARVRVLVAAAHG